MTIEDLQILCKQHKAVTEDIKWENHLCFNVGSKMFLITSPDTFPITASIKVKDDVFEELLDKEGCKPAPYLARYKWIHIDDINRLSKKEWQQYILDAYNLVANKLPLKTKKTIGLI